jgi:hypothetical protein
MLGSLSQVARKVAADAKQRQLCRCYNFASSQYDSCFAREGIPAADAATLQVLRANTVTYLQDFDAESWYEDPMVTVLEGGVLSGGTGDTTVDAFGKENGRAINATTEEVDAVIAHMASYKAQKVDNRAEVRAMEVELFSDRAAFLIGNQALDFKKQDGITEVEESLMANTIEQRMNDNLLADEQAGRIKINRAPAYVACVSNFTNFLDLSRKTLRNLELGVPVVVLSRSNTTQHMFRWFQLLVELVPKYGIDPGMITFLSAELSEQQRTVRSGSPDSPLYFTGSREVAEALRDGHGPVFSSTGGPNTLVSTELTPEVMDAVRMSACIENSGQCTALRHAVLPCTEADVEKIFEGSAVSAGPKESLAAGEFAGIFEFAGDIMTHADGYTVHKDNQNICYKHSDSLPAPGIEENWRQVYADVTSPAGGGAAIKDEAFVDELADWLVTNQPITLAVNQDEGEDFALAKRLFERTGQVVYTVGTPSDPALTCQARPQDGEIFGEFAPRAELKRYTKFPVLVPTPTPAYNAVYDEGFLVTHGKDAATSVAASAQGLAAAVKSDAVRGYVRILYEYLADVCSSNPKRGINPSGRSAL